MLAALLFAATLAAALRLPELERRPMHSDEAVQAAKTGVLFDTHQYTYDPHELHGPTLYYFTLPSLWIAGVKSYAASNEFHYRIVSVVFGIASILLLLLVRDAVGKAAVVCAGVLTAVSPAMVFYSRYYIQEIPFVFFSFALIACGWRYFKTRALFWAIMTGLCVGLMHATKETCAIVFFSIGVSLAANYFFLSKRNDSIFKINATHAILAVLAAGAISIVFFSSFFTHARGPLDSVLAFTYYFTRSSGANSHDKPWFYYAQMVLWNNKAGTPIWTEASIVGLAFVGAANAFCCSTKNDDDDAPNAFGRFLAIYTLVMFTVYSFISYKTPWCALGFLHGMILLAGIGAAEILKWMPHWSLKTLAALVLAAGAGHLAWQTVQANGRYAFDERNPYVYLHATLDAPRLAARVEELAALHPDGHAMSVQLMAPNSDYWPIPWYLRKMENVGYWNAPPARLDAPVLIASNEFADELALDLKGNYQKNQYSLRPGVLVWLYVNEDLWKKFLATRQNGIRK